MDREWRLSSGDLLGFLAASGPRVGITEIRSDRLTRWDVSIDGCGEDIDGHDTEPVVGRGTAMYREARGKVTTGEPRGDGSGTTRRS